MVLEVNCNHQVLLPQTVQDWLKQYFRKLLDCYHQVLLPQTVQAWLKQYFRKLLDCCTVSGIATPDSTGLIKAIFSQAIRLLLSGIATPDSTGLIKYRIDCTWWSLDPHFVSRHLTQREPFTCHFSAFLKHFSLRFSFCHDFPRFKALILIIYFAASGLKSVTLSLFKIIAPRTHADCACW